MTVQLPQVLKPKRYPSVTVNTFIWSTLPKDMETVLLGYMPYIQFSDGFLPLFPLLQNENVFLFFSTTILQLEMGDAYGPQQFQAILAHQTTPSAPSAGSPATALALVVSNAAQPDLFSQGWASPGADWAEFDYTWPKTLAATIAVWCRRIAHTCYFDRHFGKNGVTVQLLEYELADFSDQQLVAAWQFDPAPLDEPAGVLDMYAGTERGQEINFRILSKGESKGEVEWYPCRAVWDPNPLNVFADANEFLFWFLQKNLAATPANIAAGVVDWIREVKVWVHGAWVAQNIWAKFPPDVQLAKPMTTIKQQMHERDPEFDKAPPEGFRCQDPLQDPDEPAIFYVAYKQLSRNPIGGCPINARYIVALLRMLGLPACVGVGAVVAFDDQPAPPLDTQNVLLHATNLLLPSGDVSTGHTFVFCFGAELCLDHGDHAIVHPESGLFAPGSSIWLPAMPTFFFKQALKASSLEPPDENTWRLACQLGIFSLTANSQGVANLDPVASAWIASFGNADSVTDKQRLGALYCNMMWRETDDFPPRIQGMAEWVNSLFLAPLAELAKQLGGNPNEWASQSPRKQPLTRLLALAVMPNSEDQMPSQFVDKVTKDLWQKTLEPTGDFDITTPDVQTSMKAVIGTSWAFRFLSRIVALSDLPASDPLFAPLAAEASVLAQLFFGMDQNGFAENCQGGSALQAKFLWQFGLIDPPSLFARTFPNEFFIGAKIQPPLQCKMGDDFKHCDYRSHEAFPAQMPRFILDPGGALVAQFPVDSPALVEFLARFALLAIRWFMAVKDPAYELGQ